MANQDGWALPFETPHGDGESNLEGCEAPFVYPMPGPPPAPVTSYVQPQAVNYGVVFRPMRPVHSALSLSTSYHGNQQQQAMPPPPLPPPNYPLPRLPDAATDLRIFEERVMRLLNSMDSGGVRVQCDNPEQEMCVTQLSGTWGLELQFRRPRVANGQSQPLSVAILSQPSPSTQHPTHTPVTLHATDPPNQGSPQGRDFLLSPQSAEWDLGIGSVLTDYQPFDLLSSQCVDNFGSGSLVPSSMTLGGLEYTDVGFSRNKTPALPPASVVESSDISMAPYQLYLDMPRQIDEAQSFSRSESQQEHKPGTSSSDLPSPTSGSNRMGTLRRMWERVSSKKVENCWPCKLVRKACDSGNPCHRCKGFPNAKTLCKRGPVWKTSELPFLCPPRLPSQDTRRSTSPGSPPTLPPELCPAATELDSAKRKRGKDFKHMKERGCMAPDDRNPDNNDRNHDRNCRILVNIVTMEDLSLRGNVYRDGQHLRYDFCCDEIIGKILWELIDNPYAAEALGAGDLGDLVELLEVAARCESKESHIRQRDLKGRLVYLSLGCIWYCLELLRLDAKHLLLKNAHEFCSAERCISPGFRSLDNYIHMYVEALTGALLGKKRNESSHWSLIFYSLCIQAYVRRALLVLEKRWELLHGRDITSTGLLVSNTYLHAAAEVFSRISNRAGKLEKQIVEAPVQPSKFVGVATMGDLSSRAASAYSWDKWRDEGVGIEGHLRHVFEIGSGNMLAGQVDDNDGYETDRTIIPAQATTNNRRNRESTGSSRKPRKKHQTETAVSYGSVTSTLSRHSQASRSSNRDSMASSFLSSPDVPVPTAVASSKRTVTPAPSHNSEFTRTSVRDSAASSFMMSSNASTLSFSTGTYSSADWI